MQEHVFTCLARRIELWTHSEPDHLAMVIRSNRTFYEIDVLMKCRELYFPGTTVIDVGANIGNHAVFFGAILNAPVYAFEPYPPNQELLDRNIAANGLSGQVTVHRCAIGEFDGIGLAHQNLPNNHGTVQVQFGKGDIPFRRLDELKLAGPVGLLKVDIEGAELGALRGASRIIQEWLPDIMVEAESAEEFKAIAKFLLSFGYVLRGRYAWTPTYLFSAEDQQSRARRILAAA
jgi:FkbM family methyltransferase